jgi:hypothetical protein
VFKSNTGKKHSLDLGYLKALIEDRTIPEPNSGCWLWTGGLSSSNYGKLRFRGRSAQAHRLSYDVYKGPIPEGFSVCHKCDNPPCVNPDHLYAGTAKDNCRDKIERKRDGKTNPSPPKIFVSERASQKTLTWEVVRAIRVLRPDFPLCKEIARQFGVTTGQIHKIVRGLTWVEE